MLIMYRLGFVLMLIVTIFVNIQNYKSFYEADKLLSSKGVISDIPLHEIRNVLKGCKEILAFDVIILFFVIVMLIYKIIFI